VGLRQRLAQWTNGPEKPCTTCGRPTRDELVHEGRERVRYCRTHLVEQFVREFEKSPYRMVVYEFQPEAAGGLVYGYYPVSIFHEFNWSVEDLEKASHILLGIDKSQPCKMCGRNPWQVAYYDRDAAPWQRDSRVPDIDIDKALALCAPCAALKLSPVLKANPDEYVEGLYLPYRDHGMYATTVI